MLTRPMLGLASRIQAIAIIIGGIAIGARTQAYASCLAGRFVRSSSQANALAITRPSSTAPSPNEKVLNSSS